MTDDLNGQIMPSIDELSTANLNSELTKGQLKALRENEKGKKRKEKQTSKQLNKSSSEKKSRQIKTKKMSIQGSKSSVEETNSNRLNSNKEPKALSKKNQSNDSSKSSFEEIECVRLDTSCDLNGAFEKNLKINHNSKGDFFLKEDLFSKSQTTMILDKLTQNVQPVASNDLCDSTLDYVDEKLIEIERSTKDENDFENDILNDNSNRPTGQNTLQFCDQSILFKIVVYSEKTENPFFVMILSLDESEEDGKQVIRLGLTDGYSLCQYCLIIKPLAERISMEMLTENRILEITSYQLFVFSFVFFLEILDFNYHGLNTISTLPKLFVIPPIYPNDVVIQIERSPFSKILCIGRQSVCEFQAQCIQIDEEIINGEVIFWLALSDGVNVFQDAYISLKRVPREKLVGLSIDNCLLIVTNYEDKPFNRRIAIELIEFTFQNGSIENINRLNWIRTIPFLSETVRKIDLQNE